MDLVNKLVVFTRVIYLGCFSVFVKKSPSFQNVDIFPELDRCTPCVFIGTVARFSRNKSILISFGAPVVKGSPTICFSFFFTMLIKCLCLLEPFFIVQLHVLLGEIQQCILFSSLINNQMTLSFNINILTGIFFIARTN